MKKRIAIYLAGLLSGVIIWVVAEQISANRQQEAMNDYLAYYSEYEFMEEEPYLGFNMHELCVMPIYDLSNKQTFISLSEEKVIFLNMWASWCKPSVNELSGIENLNSKLGEKVDFYLLSNEPVDALQKFKRKTNLSLPVYSYQSEDFLPEYLKRGSIPYTLIIYKGKVWFEHLGAAPWDCAKVVDLINNIYNVYSIEI